MALKLKVLKGKASSFKIQNPVLDAGQFGYETDKARYKLGDGLTHYNDLDYLSNSVYQTWLDDGNEGEIDDFLESIVGESAYDIWLRHGSLGSEAEFLESLKGKNGKDGIDGKSAYEAWLAQGYVGSEEYFVKWLKGAKGDIGIKGDKGDRGTDGTSAYQTWLDVGNIGTESDFLATFGKGDTGASAYEVWLDVGNSGTEADFLATFGKGDKGDPGNDGAPGIDGEDGVDGKSSYEIWIEVGNEGTETDFISSLKGAKGDKGNPGEKGNSGDTAYQAWLSLGNEGYLSDFITSIKGKKGDKGDPGENGARGSQGPIGKTGPKGLSAYEVWLNAGNNGGTISDFIEGLINVETSKGDRLGQTIDTTYIKSIASENGTLTVTKGNDSSETIQVGLTVDQQSKFDTIEEGAQVNTITGIKGNNESEYRIGNINITKDNIGLGHVNDTSDIDKPVSNAQQLAISNAVAESGNYTDTAIAGLINGAPSTLDTLKEIADAFSDNNDVIEALNTSIGTKLSTSDFVSHIEDTDIHITTVERTNWNDANTKKHSHTNTSVLSATTASYTTELNNKLNGIATSAQVNVQTDYAQSDTSADDYLKNKPTKLSEFSNDMGFIIQTDIDTSQNHTHSNMTILNNTTSPFTTVLKSKLDTIDEGAEINSVTGVKGNTESSYRTGNINITANNIGLGNVDNTSDSDKPVSVEQQTAINSAKTSVIGTATASFNTLGKLYNKIIEVETLENDHEANNVAHITATERTNWNDANTKKHEHTNKAILDSMTAAYTTALNTKLGGIATGAQVNTVTGVKGNSEATYRTGNINITAANVGLGNVDNTSDSNKPISTAQQIAIENAEDNANNYTDTAIAGLINGAPSTLDTLKEIADAFSDNQSVISALNTSIGTKANIADLVAHTNSTTVHVSGTERTNWNDANTKKHSHTNTSVLSATTASYTTGLNNKLNGIANGATVSGTVYRTPIDVVATGASLTPATWTSICYSSLPIGTYRVYMLANILNANEDVKLVQPVFTNSAHGVVLTPIDISSSQLGDNWGECLVQINTATNLYLQVYSTTAASVNGRSLVAVRL